MRDAHQLHLGVAAAILFAVGLISLPLLVPGYDAVRQTVSEIGEMSSPARWPFAIMLLTVAAMIFVFALALRRAAVRLRRSTAPAYFIAFMAISAAGIGIFAYPHPLHNVFGLSETIAYLAPLVVALCWGRAEAAKSFVLGSLIAGALLIASIGLNAAVLDRASALWHYERPVYGLVQRSLFLVWFAWLAIFGILVRREVMTTASSATRNPSAS